MFPVCRKKSKCDEHNFDNLATYVHLYRPRSLCVSAYSKPIVIRKITRLADRESSLSPPIFTFLVRLVRLAEVITAAKEEVRYR